MKLRIVANDVLDKEAADPKPNKRTVIPRKRPPITKLGPEEEASAPEEKAEPKETKKEAPKEKPPGKKKKQPAEPKQEEKAGPETVEDRPKKKRAPKQPKKEAPEQDYVEEQDIPWTWNEAEPTTPPTEVVTSSPAQTVMSLSNVIDTIATLGQKAVADIQKIPEEAFKTNPTEMRKQVEALIEPLTEQMQNLQKITEALVAQAQAT